MLLFSRNLTAFLQAFTKDRMFQLDLSDDQLLHDYDPPLTQAELDAAWDYYEKHREEIDQAIRLNEED